VRRRNALGWPLRAIVSHTLRKERGPTGRIYLDERLACGHNSQTYATGGARKARQRGCFTCWHLERERQRAGRPL
jgi:hypothetical protein